MTLNEAQGWYFKTCVSYDLQQRKWSDSWIKLQTLRDIGFAHKDSPFRTPEDEKIENDWKEAIRKEDEEKNKLILLKKELDEAYIIYSNYLKKYATLPIRHKGKVT